MDSEDESVSDEESVNSTYSYDDGNDEEDAIVESTFVKEYNLKKKS